MVKLLLSHAQVLKAKRGEAIQLKASAIDHSSGHTFTNLHPETLKKINTAKRLKKGVRVHLTIDELSGAGFMDVIRKVGKFISKNKAILKPIASAVLDAGATLYPPAAPIRQKVKEMTGVGMNETVLAPVGFPVVEKVKKVKKTGKRKTVKQKSMKGRGIVPAGYAGF